MTHPSTAGGPPGPGGMPIGYVVNVLSQEFDGVTVSKIRFLETQGLVNPERSDSGIRVFAQEDLQRLRYILTAQRDRFWPLRVIKAHLEHIERAGLQPEASGPPTQGATQPTQEVAQLAGAAATDTPPPPAVEPPIRRRSVRVTPIELRERTGLDAATYGALKSFGLLRTDLAGRHGVEDIDIAEQAAALAGYGIEARHLRLFRVAADREVGLAEQILEPLRRRRARGAPGPDPEQVQADIVARSLALHTALVRAGLRSHR
ncbi:MAG: MerR family transcriptional regulator [Ornithinimicrobium sp.]